MSFSPIVPTEDLLRKENAVPLKAQAIPTKAQRPTPPPVSVFLDLN